jgi:hypothetical protein
MGIRSVITMRFNYDLKDRNVFSYSQYREHKNRLLSSNKTTGADHSDSKIAYTQLNVTRMNRLDKKSEIREDLASLIKGLEAQTWLVLSEAWCGDAAQNLPWIQKMAELNPKISYKIILRDENLDIMDEFLTNNGRGIPKLIAIDNSNEVLFDWGPRPGYIQNKFLELRAHGLNHADVTKSIQLLYARDKGMSIQNDFLDLLKQLEMVKV